MAELKGLVRALCEGDDPAKAAAARALGNFAYNNSANKAAIAKARGIPPLVDLLRDGSAKAKEDAARTLSSLACSIANGVLIVADGAIPPLIDLLRDGGANAKVRAAAALHYLAYHNDANKVAIAEGGGIPPLLQLRCGRIFVPEAAAALGNLVHGNDAHAVAVAATVGLEALVQLARRGRVTIVSYEVVVRNAGIAAKRKAALVVAELLRACVPDELRSRADVQDLIRDVIGPYL